MFMGFKAVFIDIDNTLLDFDLAIIDSLKTGFKKFSLGEYKESYYESFTRINNSLWQRLENKEISFEELKRIRFDMVFEEIGIDFEGSKFEAYFREQLRSVVFPIDGSVDLLKYLKNKYLVILASNGPTQQQITRIKLGGMIEYQDYIFASEFIGASKPSSEYFEKCFSILEHDGISLKKDECVMIGDSLTSDINGAKQMGITTIFFDKHKKFDQIPSSNVDMMVKSLSEIKNIL